MSDAIVRSGAAQIRVTDLGEGPAVTFLHAGVADRRSWTAVMETVSKSHRAIAYDQRGYGETTYTPEPYSHTADLLAVLDASGVGSSVLVGCSRGGQIAFDAAITHPDRVDALVLIDSAPSGGPDPAPVGPEIEKLGAAIEEAEADGRLEEVNELEAQLWLDGPEAPAGRVSGPARDLFLAMNGPALTATPPGEARPFAGWDQLRELEVPTLLMVGALDLPPLVERVKAMAETIEGARLVVLGDTAHLPMLEQPDEVAGHILHFLTQLP